MNWKTVKLGEVTSNLDSKRKPLNSSERDEKRGAGRYPYFGANNQVDRIDDFIFDEKILCVAEDGGSWGALEKCSYIVNEKCWVNNHAHVVTAKSNLLLEYLHYFLNWKDLNANISGTTRGKLTKASLNSIEIPLPPLAQQQRIAARLDAADRLRVLRCDALARLDALAHSLFLEMFGDPAHNPMNWPVVKMGEVAKAHYGKALKADDRDQTGEFDVFGSSGKVGNHTATLTTEPTIIIGRKGSVGALTLAKRGGWTIDTAYYVEILDKGKFDLLYLYWSLDFARLGELTITTAIPGLNRDALYRVGVLVPPLALQRAFAARLEQIETVRARMETSALELDALFASLQSAAFDGQ